MERVDLRVSGMVAEIILANPPGNRIDFKMREEVLASLNEVSTSESRVLLIRGDGEDFCLGGDVREWTGRPGNELRPKIEVFAEAIDTLRDLPLPTIAVVQGACMGGGFELALGCDMILAADTAHFTFPEAMLGIMTLQGGVYMLAERIGRSKALEVVMLSDRIDAARMRDWNVVNEVVSHDRLDDAVSHLAARLASGPADAYARTKQLMRLWEDGGRAAARHALYDMTMPLFDEPAVQRALESASEAAQHGRSLPRVTF